MASATDISKINNSNIEIAKEVDSIINEIEDGKKNNPPLPVEVQQPRIIQQHEMQQQPIEQYQPPQMIPQYIPVQQPPQNFYPQPQMKEEIKIETESLFSMNKLKNAILLLVLLIVFNNNIFKNLLTKIPFTTNEEGGYTFLMGIILTILITSSFFLFSSIFI
jgi:hypothetical protein